MNRLRGTGLIPRGVYQVVREASEIVVDLMQSACGIRDDDASERIETIMIDDVPIPSMSSAGAPASVVSLLGDRSMVGQLALDQHIGVRLPVSQPRFSILRLRT